MFSLRHATFEVHQMLPEVYNSSRKLALQTRRQNLSVVQVYFHTRYGSLPAFETSSQISDLAPNLQRLEIIGCQLGGFELEK